MTFSLLLQVDSETRQETTADPRCNQEAGKKSLYYHGNNIHLHMYLVTILLTVQS